METTKFYEVLESLRRKDSASPTGYESDLAFSQRLGLANKTITLYRRGAVPKAETIKKIQLRGGYTNDEMYKLLAAAAEISGNFVTSWIRHLLIDRLL